MRKVSKYIIIITSVFFSSLTLANESIYYIDMDYIMNNSLAGKSIIKQLADQSKTNSDNFKKTEANLKKEETKLINQKNVLEKKEFEEKAQLFAKKIEKFKEELQVTQNTFSKKKIEAQKKLVEQITPILADYSQKNKISYIIPKQNIIIGKTALDLTNKIVTILNDKIKSIKVK